eukprot:c1611_g1_i1.p1 GENE.c1611_g1_i1~~c1611_g1_i1.p1  ORF type:complete len:278 (+),score=53.00 c1611_g1_i1:35-835(+)
MAASVYAIDEYTFGTKEAPRKRDLSVRASLERLEAKVKAQGMRRTVLAVVLVHLHSFPHVLLLRVRTQGNPEYYKLPGGRLRPGEDMVEGLKRKLNNKLAPKPTQTQTPIIIPWDVGELICTWYRPEYKPFVYPYQPPHITTCTEIRRTFFVSLPGKCVFAVPKNLGLIAVPLFDLHDNAQRFGIEIAALPALLSRFRLVYVQASKGVSEAGDAKPGDSIRPEDKSMAGAPEGEHDEMPTAMEDEIAFDREEDEYAEDDNVYDAAE